ncbi:MAG: PQQ-binding-like beta-propeller repeat protein [Bryobacterales bacterium]|nr:PQQ-binding-like beta-propeller repeat protein [Bryobacterales bacterium]MBV9400577.1 PQQ-binding-like beta-propeller repeat protein [Bryobacterales bacterium]
MKKLIGACAGFAGLCAYGLLAQTQPNAGNVGSDLFARECAMCHVAGNNDRAPSLQALRELAPEAIVTALTTGRMAAQAQRLSPADRVAVAEFVSGRGIAAVRGSSTGLCASTTSSTSFEVAFNRPSWNGWGGTLGSARYAKDGGIAAADVPRLKLAWAFGFPRALSARTQPTIVGDWLFTASDTGEVFALDAKTGCIRWTYTAKAGVRGALSVASLGSGKYGVFFGDGQANAYGVDAQTGRQLWILKVDAHPNAVITGAPAVYDGRLYVPTSGVGEESRGQDPNYACCSFRGSISAIDIRNGELRWKSYAIQPEPRPRGQSSQGVQLLGPAGAGIWSSPTIDASRGVLYVGTGNGYAGPEQPTMNAIIAMDLKTGAHKWVRQTVPNDIWLMQCQSQAAGKAPTRPNANCPDQEGPDFDFSSAPLLTKTASGRELLVVPQKSGVLWALDPDKQGTVVWQYRYGRGSGLGGQWGAAADGGNAYIGTGDALSPQPGGMHAVNLETGQRAWFVPPQEKLCNASDRRCSASQGAAITAIPGVVFSAGGDGGLRAYAAKDGAILWSFDTNRPFQTVNGVPANGGTMDASGAVVAGGMVFVNSGYNSFVGRAGNVLLAFRVE